MSRRVSRSAAALFALIISVSAPSAFAAPNRDGGAGPDPGARIIQIIKSVIRHLNPVTNVEWPSIPKP
jgi:hypothetical protein